MASPMNVGPGLGTRVPPAPANHNIVPAYSLVVAGAPQAGKSSLLRLILDTALISPHATQAQLESLARFVRASAEPRFTECEVEVLSHGERVLLRLLDTPGLDFSPGAEDDVERALRDIIGLVEDRYVEGARDESTVGESHIHLCLYVLDPSNIVPRPPATSSAYPYRRTSPASSSSSDYSPGLGARPPYHYLPSLPPAEISAIRRLSSRVNVLPVLGRCDAVSVEHLAEIKRAVRRNLADAGLGFGIFDEEGEAGAAPTALPVASPATLAQLVSSPCVKPDPVSPRTHSPPGQQPSPPPTSAPVSVTAQSDMQQPGPDARAPADLRTALDSPHTQSPLHTETIPLLPFALFAPECYAIQRRPSKRELVGLYAAVAEGSRDRDLGEAADGQRNHDSKAGKRDRDADDRLDMLRGRFVRRYRWGVLDVLDPRHSDFAALRRAAMGCRKELKTYTKDYLYEKFKVDSLLAAQSQARAGPGVVPVAQSVSVSVGHHLSPHVVSSHGAAHAHNHVSSSAQHSMRGLAQGQTQIQAQAHVLPPPSPYGSQTIQHPHQHQLPSPHHIPQAHAHAQLPPPPPPAPSSHISSSTIVPPPPPHPNSGGAQQRHTSQHSPQHQLPPIVPSHHPGSVHALLNHGHGHGEVYKREREEGALYKREREREEAYKREREEEEVYKREREEEVYKREREEREREGRDPPTVTVLGLENGTGVGTGTGAVSATGLTVNGRKRKITMACNFCRSRKLKCDGLRPACAQCVKRGNSCDYQPHAHAPAAVPPPSAPVTSHAALPHPHTPSIPAQQLQVHPPSSGHSPQQVGAWRYKAGGARGHPAPPPSPGPPSHPQHPHAHGQHMHDPISMERDRGEDVDELDDDGVSSEGGDVDGGVKSAGAGAAAAGVYGGGRKRVSVDMLIAETLGDGGAAAGAGPGGGKAGRGGGAPAHNGNGEQRYPGGGYTAGSASVLATSAPAGPGAANGETGPWYAEADGVGAGMGMGVIDVGSEGDKKKRLNRQSANYGSKAVACVHCRARKTRCDAARPACGNCARRSLACSYIHTQPSQPRSKGKKAAAIAAAKEEAARNATGPAKANGAGDSPGSQHSGTRSSTTTTHESAARLSRGSPQLQLQPHPDWHLHAHGRAHPHGHPHHAHSHNHTGGHSPQPPQGHGRSPLHVLPPGSPIRVDDRLIEESAERDRPLTRSPATGPPIATLPAAATSPSSAPSPASAITTLANGSKHDTPTPTPTPHINGTGGGGGGYMNGIGTGAVHVVRHSVKKMVDGGASGTRSGSVTPAGDVRSRSNSVGADGGGGVIRGAKRKSPPGGMDNVSDREHGYGEHERPEKKKCTAWRDSEDDGSGDEARVRM